MNKLVWCDFRRLVILFAMFCLTVCFIIYNGLEINKYNEQEVQHNMQVMMEQQVDIIAANFTKHQQLAEAVAFDLQNCYEAPERVSHVLARRQALKTIYGFTKLGFINPEGDLINSDGLAGNVKERDYLAQSLKGKTIISSVMKDGINLGEKAINVISVPAYNKNFDIIGVVVVAFNNHELTDLLARGFFSEYGNIALIDEQKKIVATNRSNSFWRDRGNLLANVVDHSDHSSHTLAWRLSNSLPKNRYEQDGGLHVLHSPVDLKGKSSRLFLVAAVSDATMEARTVYYKERTTFILLGIVAIISLTFIYYLYDIRKQYLKQKQQLMNIAFVDPVTGGDNYAALKDKLENHPQAGYIVYMNLRNYPIIQSIYGNKKSEQLLTRANVIVQTCLSKNGILAHLESGRFAIFIENIAEENLKKALEVIVAKLHTFAERENILSLGCAFGVMRMQAKDDLDDCLGKANTAFKSILNRNDVLYAFSGETEAKTLLEDSLLEQNFFSLLNNKNFEVWYQPKIDPFNENIVGAEALVRLNNGNGIITPPYKFIPLFESNGLIYQLDEYVFRTVCELQKGRLEASMITVPISVNLSRMSLYHPDLVEKYDKIIKNIGIIPRLVPLEITESATININNICSLLDDFCAKGFKLHMDDFGSGYSSLSALNILPFTTIKIDKSLVDYIGERSGNELIKHVVALAKSLQLHVTVEGVETKEQVEFLKKQNCHSIQGFYYSKPLPEKEFLELLAQKNITVMKK